MDGTTTTNPSPSLISILCPTRKRPPRVLKMVTSALEMAERPDQLEFVFYADEDDLSIYGVVWPCDRSGYPAKVRVRTGPRQPMQGNNWNLAYEWAKGDILMMAADDIVFETAGWDETVRQTFAQYPDHILLAYADDRIPGMGDRVVLQVTHPFLHRRWVETVGYMCPPYFEVYWSDTWIHEVSDRIRRRAVLPGVRTTHYHFMSGLVERDQTYLDAEAKHCMGIRWRWESLVDRRIEDAEKLQRAIDSFVGEPGDPVVLGS